MAALRPPLEKFQNREADKLEEECLIPPARFLIKGIILIQPLQNLFAFLFQQLRYNRIIV